MKLITNFRHNVTWKLYWMCPKMANSFSFQFSAGKLPHNRVKASKYPNDMNAKRIQFQYQTNFIITINNKLLIYLIFPRKVIYKFSCFCERQVSMSTEETAVIPCKNFTRERRDMQQNETVIPFRSEFERKNAIKRWTVSLHCKHSYTDLYTQYISRIWRMQFHNICTAVEKSGNYFWWMRTFAVCVLLTYKTKLN